MILQLIMSFVASLAFSILFNVPKKELVFCGLTGALGWTTYLLIYNSSLSVLLATIIATMIVTFISRILAVLRKMPLTVFLIGGIIPLVPGAGIYDTMFNIITGEALSAAAMGVHTLKVAGTIAVGIMIVLSLPPQLFLAFKPSKAKAL